MIEFDVFISYNRIHRPEYYQRSLFAERLDEAKLADRLGYGCVWVPEHHLIHFMQAPSASLLAMQIGLNVDCKVGQMVNLLNYRHPLITAGEVAFLDNALEGRLELGVGRGAYEYEFERLGIPFAEAQPRFLEALEVLEKIWNSESAAITHKGRYFDIDEAYVWPRPYQKPHPRLWYAAMSGPSVKMAASKGYHVANWPFLRPMSAVKDIADTFHEAREQAGGVRGEQQLAIMRSAFAAETAAEARRHTGEALTNHRINQRLHHFTQNADPRGVVSPEPIDNEPDEATIYQNMLMGTPEECLAKVEEYEALGVDRLLLHFDFGPDHEAVLESMRVFAEGVIEPYRRSRHKQLAPAASPAS
ncbi:LLM class flavin-dependent oxidoreductase [Amycolatopsis acidiphila]|uniref:LLM class flavin-dependent oxidoreductase n=1 Tax=Amycolatopsis acidiphila TaxID=715473 RepID=UPI001643CBC3|nr:LLM class flavin-dependent oxidoreductase [Amycolatopsis acidiphila]UIJ62573.1 LLM class flavin-dependent oxidoreductase [Amycolatopsis acidiphila]GHG85500.1 monooxygenase [Amycolatopsis acidiphila]